MNTVDRVKHAIIPGKAGILGAGPRDHPQGQGEATNLWAVHAFGIHFNSTRHQLMDTLTSFFHDHLEPVLSSPQVQEASMKISLVYQQYQELCQGFEPQLLLWANPSGVYTQSPMTDYPLASLSSAGLVVIAYLVSVLFLSGIMKTGLVGPFNLRWLQYLYNPVQIILCSYMCLETGLLAIRNDYSVVCNTFDVTKPVMGNVAWLFLMSKVLDFVDTFIIILSCKWRQLTLLHVYHHVSVFGVFWMFFKAAYDGDLYVTLIGNALVHAMMYTYYFLSLHTKDIWWKKYLTAVQMIQFITFLVHSRFVLSCPDYPQPITAMYMVYISTLFALFLQFFIRSYVTTSNEKQPMKTSLKKKSNHKKHQ